MSEVVRSEDMLNSVSTQVIPDVRPADLRVPIRSATLFPVETKCTIRMRYRIE